MSLGKLYVIATPIGNLKDITFRALEKLKEVDAILCEDTRQTWKLCQTYEIDTPLISYHQHSKIKKLREIANLIGQGKNLALVCDAGTPGISDPGHKLIDYLLKKYNSLEIVPFPGPSVLSTILSVCDFSIDRFIFLGFLPLKKKRKKILEQISQSEYPVVFFESPHRILKTLTELSNFPRLENQSILVGRELTKKFETITRGTIKEVQKTIQQNPLKGEFVIVINSRKNN